jgi:hypothetical protein
LVHRSRFGYRYTQIWSRIDRLSGLEHLKIDVRADGDSSSSNNTELLAWGNGSFALGKRWGGRAQMAVDADEAIDALPLISSDQHRHRLDHRCRYRPIASGNDDYPQRLDATIGALVCSSS